MMSASDLGDSIFSSIQVFREAIAPIESSIRRVAKDFECQLGGPKSEGNSLDLISQSVQICAVKKKNNQQCVVGGERKKGVPVDVMVKAFLRMFSHNREMEQKGEGSKNELKKRDLSRDGVTAANFLQFTVPCPFMVDKKLFHKMGKEEEVCLPLKERKSMEALLHMSGKNVSVQRLIGNLCQQLAQTLQNFDRGIQERDLEDLDAFDQVESSSQVDNWKLVRSIFESRKADVNGFLGNLRFARVGGVFSSIGGATVEEDDCVASVSAVETGVNSGQKMATQILSIPLPNVELLRSNMSNVSLMGLVELLPHLGGAAPRIHPNKKKLISVQDFFTYTECEGRRFFEELDRDGDGQVTLEDLEIAIKRRKLPQAYAREFMNRARSHLFSKSFGWKKFLSLMEQKEPTILRAYTSLCLNNSGALQKTEILESLRNAGLPANEDNAMVMLRFLNADTEESVSYGHFRDFMLLLPSARLKEDARIVWFEAATVVAVAPPVDIPTKGLLKSALAGGISCAFSTALMHPVDTIKTYVQASTTQSFLNILSKLPQTGVRVLYRGSIPAIVGQFSSHGLRMGIFEASKSVLMCVAPTLPDIQVQYLASFCSTFLGTASRIPSEVLKQRLQAGLFDNVGEALLVTWKEDGLKGFFRGTGATLCREVPFYVFGTGLYTESKKIVQHLLGRELVPWETVVVGAISGGLTAVSTTPLDVIKTRMMIAQQGLPVSMSMVAFSILHHEGPLALYKGAVPRFFWVAPLGAINFAGYELLRKAMDSD